MIARVLIPLLLSIVLSDAYLSYRFLRRRRWPWHLLWWMPAFCLMVWTVLLSREKNFIPDPPEPLYLYLFLYGLLVVPKLAFTLFSCVGALLARVCRSRRNYGEPLGLLVALFLLYALFYGTFVGADQIEVRRVSVAFDDLPPAFDGYRIVQFSDAHVGTYTGGRQPFLQRAVDSINAQRADLIAFTGDLQNIRPEEIEPHVALLKKLKAKDGVFSVVGNHDYAEYVDTDYITKALNFEKTVSLEQDMGWKVLINSRRFVRRGQDSIVVAGMDNDGEGRFPANGSINSALWGVMRSQFVVMLEHDPSSWRRKILPHSHVQLTLSGHTHGGQFSLGGWSPASFRYREYDGLYCVGGRCLHVSRGLGGVIPFRFGATGEIVVITLKKKTEVEKPQS